MYRTAILSNNFIEQANQLTQIKLKAGPFKLSYKKDNLSYSITITPKSDNKFDFMDYPAIWERLLLTDGIEHARFASDTPAIEAMIFIDYIKEVS